MSRVAVFLFCTVLLLAGCHKKRVPVPPPPGPISNSGTPIPAAPGPGRSPRPPAAPPPEVGAVERGVASWYGHPYHGRAAADGEIYDMETLVAAHRTLPFQTMVRVRNVRNDKTVDVRIIDRGPFIAGRIIDLSHAAAKEIELIGPGFGPVELTILSAPAAAGPGLYAVQVGAFRERANADRMQERMRTEYGSAKEVLRQGDPPLWRVLAGREITPEAAEVLAQRVRTEQGVSGAFVVRLDQ